MMKLIFDKRVLDELEITSGVEVLAPDYDFSVAYEGTDGIVVCLENVPGMELKVACKDGKATFTFDFTMRQHFYRCLSLLLEELTAGKTEVSLEETAWFRHCGPLLDLSQGNSVLTVQRWKYFIKKAAMMGLSQCILYMEDNFDVPEEPYFGYMRGRYTYEQLKELDDYAYALAIELIPAVQSLGHFTETLQWDVYTHLRENAHCIIPEQEESYEFVRHIITAASKPFRTKRISIGMDECFGLGHGTYFKRHGYVEPGVILDRHLRKVMEITSELGLRPMVADDMFLRPFGGHFKEWVVVPQEYSDSLPKGFDVLYWDYYDEDADKFRRLADQRFMLSDHVIFQGGIWTWTGFAPNWTMTFVTTNPAMEAIKDKGIDDVQCTVWGDSGTESDIRLVLFGMQLFAEHCYTKVPTEEQLRRRFKFCCNGDYDAFWMLQELDYIPGVPPRDEQARPNFQRNASKFLIWQDPLHGLFDKNIEGLPLNAHYEALEKKIAAADHGEYADMFEMYRLFASVLALKAELGIQIHTAYRNDDKAELARLAGEVIPECLRRTKALRDQHYQCWLSNNMLLGWEILDMRYGSLMIRLQTAADALNDYLSGKRQRLEEVEEIQRLYNGEEGIPYFTNYYGKLVSASRIAPEFFTPKLPAR